MFEWDAQGLLTARRTARRYDLSLPVTIHVPVGKQTCNGKTHSDSALQISPFKLARRWLSPAILFAVLSIVFPCRAQAQQPLVPSLKQYSFEDYINQTSGTFTFNTQLTGAGDIIVVSCVYTPNYGHCTSVPTDTEGNTYSLVSTKETANGSAGQKVYYALDIAGGTHDTVTCYSELVTGISCDGR